MRTGTSRSFIAVASIAVALVATAPACRDPNGAVARDPAPRLDRDEKPSTSTITGGPLLIDAGQGPGALDPETAAAAERASVPRVNARPVIPEPLPRTGAAPPPPPPAALPAAPQGVVPVVPPKHASPVLVPVEEPLVTDAGRDGARP